MRTMKRNIRYTLGIAALAALTALAAGMPAPHIGARVAIEGMAATRVTDIVEAADTASTAALPAFAPSDKSGASADGYAVAADDVDERKESLMFDAAAPLATAPYAENLFSIETVPSATGTPAPSASIKPSSDKPLPAATAAPPVATPVGFGITVLSPDGGERKKRVLIYHTHTYEAYEQDASSAYEETERWRTADSRCNMVRVGEELATLLIAQGLEVTHDTAAFEPPDLAGAYARSLQMLEARLKTGERYDLYIDLHRDAYSASQTGSNTVSVGGAEVARLMLLIGKGEGQTSEGFDEKPDWQANLLVAQAITDTLNAQREGLCKSVRLKSGRFNQHVDVGCVLVEAGNNRNSLSEALAAMPYLADAIAEVLEGAGDVALTAQ